ncbi:UNVERIFIED_ORG: hypothetical protein OKW15_002479 [Pseudomonas reinekei]|nr:hypothetical protein [Pseudomonas reinekei]
MEYLLLAGLIVLPAIIPITIAILLQPTDGLITRAVEIAKLRADKGLSTQPLFWLCIFIPTSYFLAFGIVSWNGYSLSLDAAGLKTFISISAVPLGLLSLSLPLTVIAASFHSTEQTARQIRNTKSIQEYQHQLRKYDQEIVALNTLKLITVELGEAWKIYSTEYAVELFRTDEDAPYVATYPLGEGLFPIYDSASAHLSSAPFEITSNIVRIYMRIKGLITTLNENNRNSILVRGIAVSEADKELRLLRDNGASNPEVLQGRWQEIFQFSCAREAHNLNMRYEANSLKNLTRELHDLLEIVITETNEHIQRNTPVAPTPPALE